MSEENGNPEISELEGRSRNDRDGAEESRKKPKTTPAKQPWDVEIDVHLTKACPNPVFELYSTLPTQNGKITFENNHRPGFNIRFNLYDETGGNYVFPPQPKVREACWSKIGSTCPSSPVWDVLDPRRVENGGTTLVVYNDNPSPPLGEFHYALRVTNDGGLTYCPLDPVGGDQNGPRS
jgi:hypothetical protein